MILLIYANAYWNWAYTLANNSQRSTFLLYFDRKQLVLAIKDVSRRETKDGSFWLGSPHWQVRQKERLLLRPNLEIK